MRELVLHIGTHKTGSTSIQQSLYESAKDLLEQGVCYPVKYTKWGGHHQLPWSLGINHPHKDENLAVDSILKEWLGGESGKVILSSEDFEFLPKPLLIKFKEKLKPYGVKVKVIMYVRDQASYLISDYKQHVKMPHTRYGGHLYDFVVAINFERRFDYFSRAKMWQNVFGGAVVDGRIFSRECLVGGDVVHDFCARESIVCSTIMKDNVSMSDLQAYAMSVMNSKNTSAKKQQEFLRSGVWCEFERDAPDYSLLTDENKRSVEKRFAQANNKFFREIGAVNGDHFSVSKLKGLSKERQMLIESGVRDLIGGCL